MSIFERFVCKLLITVIAIGMVVAIFAIGVLIVMETQPSIVSAENLDVENNIADETESKSEVIEVTQIEQTVEPTLEEKYASVFAWQVYSGDFGPEQLHFLEEQCTKYDIPMEIMLAIICTESGFRSDAKASSSTASGYCQILKGSAEWVYESLLKYGEYDTENHTEIMTTDWQLNIEMGCRIIYCWYWNFGESWEIAIQRYHGGSEEAKDTYLNAVNSHMKNLFNMTTADFE